MRYSDKIYNVTMRQFTTFTKFTTYKIYNVTISFFLVPASLWIVLLKETGMYLTNMRVQRLIDDPTAQENARKFAEWLLQIGDGQMEAVQIPEKMHVNLGFFWSAHVNPTKQNRNSFPQVSKSNPVAPTHLLLLFLFFFFKKKKTAKMFLNGPRWVGGAMNSVG